MRVISLTVFSLGLLGQLHAQPVPRLEAVGFYDTGLGGNGAEIISVREMDNLGAITNIAGSVDLLDLSDPASMALIRRVVVPSSLGTPNSVAIHPHLDYFLVVSGSAGQQGWVSAFRISDGVLLNSALVGIQPDSVSISPNGQYAVVANEAEGVGAGNDGGAGSISVVALTGFNPKQPGELDVTQVPLPSASGLAGFSTGRTDDLARLPITNLPATLEPESIAFSEDSTFAFVTLQENNAVARLNVKTGALTYFGLGTTTHLFDVTNNDGYNLVLRTELREPDGIGVFTGLDDVRYFVTADEGDSRNSTGSGSVRGGRTVSVFRAADGAFQGDTADQIDHAALVAGSYPHGRSNRGGSEPEVLDVTHHKGRILVAVGLERAASVVLVDVTNPQQPAVIDIAQTGNNPEGVKFFKVNGRLYVLAANEVDGTVSALAVE